MSSNNAVRFKDAVFTGVVNGEKITVTGKIISDNVLEEEKEENEGQQELGDDDGFEKITWLKVMRRSLPKLAGCANSAFITVLIYVISIMRFKQNRFNCSQLEIVNSTGLSKSAVSKVFNMLLDNDIIRVYKLGEYMMNPDCLYAGGTTLGRAFKQAYKLLPPPVRKANVNKKNPEAKEKAANEQNSYDLRHTEDLRDSGSGYDENETDYVHT